MTSEVVEYTGESSFGEGQGNDTRLRRGAQIVMEHRLTVTEAEVKPKFDPDSRVDLRERFALM